MPIRTSTLLAVCAALGAGACGGVRTAEAPAPSRAAVAAASAPDGYGACADPIRVSAAPAADEAGAILAVRAFMERLRGPAGEPVRARRLGPGACEGVSDPALSVLDFWMVDGRTLVVAPYAPGAPQAPAGFTLLAA
jgi:hypothetical protein